jgi:hypothetical protein
VIEIDKILRIAVGMAVGAVVLFLDINSSDEFDEVA